jgi:hypothetical protein
VGDLVDPVGVDVGVGMRGGVAVAVGVSVGVVVRHAGPFSGLGEWVWLNHAEDNPDLPSGIGPDGGRTASPR